MGQDKQFRFKRCNRCGKNMRRAWVAKGNVYCYICYKGKLNTAMFVNLYGKNIGRGYTEKKLQKRKEKEEEKLSILQEKIKDLRDV